MIPVTKIIDYENGEMNEEQITKIIDYENGEMNEEQMISFFQELIDSGVAWRLQGSYVRAAEDLIEQGLCYLPKDA